MIFRSKENISDLIFDDIALFVIVGPKEPFSTTEVRCAFLSQPTNFAGEVDDFSSFSLRLSNNMYKMVETCWYFWVKVVKKAMKRTLTSCWKISV